MDRRILIFFGAAATGAALLLPSLAFADGDPHAAAAAASHAVEAAGHAAEAAAHGGEHGGDHHGPPWVSLGLHAFNLVLLLGVIGWFAGPKIKAALGTRAAEIKRDIDESNRLRKETRDRFEELEARLAGFEKELSAMKGQAEAEAVKEAAAIDARADRDVARITESAERTIRNETAKARMALRRDAVALAVDLAEEQLRAQLGPQDDQRLAGDLLTLVEDSAANASQGVTHG